MSKGTKTEVTSLRSPCSGVYVCKLARVPMSGYKTRLTWASWSVQRQEQIKAVMEKIETIIGAIGH